MKESAILTREKLSLESHSKKYRLYFIGHIIILGVGAIAGAISAFGQSSAAEGTVYAGATLLFWSGILSSISAMVVGLGLTANVAKQKSRRDFHRLMVGKLTRGSITEEKAETMIDEYFENWRD